MIISEQNQIVGGVVKSILYGVGLMEHAAITIPYWTN